MTGAYIPARNAGCVCPANRRPEIVVVHSIDIHSKHQVLFRSELVIQSSVEEKLTIVTRIVEMTVSR
jgi:hypothetical protein